MADRQVRSNGQLIAARQTPIPSGGRASGNDWHAGRCRVLEQRTYLNLNLNLILILILILIQLRADVL